MADNIEPSTYLAPGAESAGQIPEDPVENKKRPSPRVWLVGGIVTVLALLGAAYLAWSGNAAPTTYTGPIEKIAIGNIGEYSILNLLAKDKGYFTKNGLDADITEYASGPPAITALLANEVDVAIAADFVGVNNIFTHNNLRILAQVGQQYTFEVITRKDKNIKQPADLRGKTIGVTKKSAGEFFLARFASLNNIALADLNLVNLTPSDMVTQIKSGTIDAIVIFEPHAYNLKKSLGDQAVHWSAQGTEAALAVAYSTETFTNKHPEAVRRYLAALAEAEQFVLTHPNQAKQDLARILKYDKVYVEYMWPKFEFGLHLEQNLLLTMEDQARFLINNKLIDQTTVPNYLGNIYFAGLETVKPEVVTIIH